MKVEVKNIVRPIALAEYLPEFGDQVIYAWINPPREMFVRRAEQIARAVSIRKQLSELKNLTDDESKQKVELLARDLERVGEEMIAWLSEIWSQHDDPETHLSPADVRTLANELIERMPGMYEWLIEQTNKLISEYRKKK